MKRLTAGYQIEGRIKRLHDLAVVEVCKLGVADSRSWLTPAEARALAAMLIEVAEYAEDEP